MGWTLDAIAVSVAVEGLYFYWMLRIRMHGLQLWHVRDKPVYLALGQVAAAVVYGVAWAQLWDISSRETMLPWEWALVGVFGAASALMIVRLTALVSDGVRVGMPSLEREPSLAEVELEADVQADEPVRALAKRQPLRHEPIMPPPSLKEAVADYMTQQ